METRNPCEFRPLLVHLIDALPLSIRQYLLLRLRQRIRPDISDKLLVLLSSMQAICVEEPASRHACVLLCHQACEVCLAKITNFIGGVFKRAVTLTPFHLGTVFRQSNRVVQELKTHNRLTLCRILQNLVNRLDHLEMIQSFLRLLVTSIFGEPP